jgi:hypothetical protein
VGVPNLATDESCGASIVASTFLMPLANNGGSTLTYAPVPMSPAINTGDNGICAAAPINNVDQRGFTRMQGPRCDLGAFEANDISQLLYTYLPWILKNP